MLTAKWRPSFKKSCSEQRWSRQINTSVDINELDDLADQHPEIVERLSQRLDDMVAHGSRKQDESR